MNSVIETIKKRRSVRSYKADPVPRDVLEAVIDAGNWATTGNNLQPWRFVVVEDADLRRKLVEAARPFWRRFIGEWVESEDAYLHEYFVDFFPRCLGWPRQPYREAMVRARDMDDGIYWGAPVVIFCIGTATQDCAMACQNMMLAATALGLGSCIVGFGAQVTGDEEIVKALELEENERIYGPVVVGYAKINPDPPPKKPPKVKWI